MSQKPHPTQTPEYWENLARSERVFAQQKRTSRSGTVESIRAHEAAAAEYEETARRLRNEAVPTSSTIAAIVGVNAALYRIKDGRPAEAIEPLESALKALKGEPIAQAEPQEPRS